MLPEKSFRERLAEFYKKHPVLGDMLIGLFAGIVIAGFLATLIPTGLIVAPVVGLAIGVGFAIVTFVSLLAMAIGAIKRKCISAPPAEVEMVEFKQNDTTPAPTSSPKSSTTLSHLSFGAQADLLATLKKVAAQEIKDEEDAEARQKEAALQALEEAKRQKAAADEAAAKVLAQEIMELLDYHPAVTHSLPVLDAEDFFNRYSAQGYSLNIEGKIPITHPDYHTITTKFAQFKDLVNKDEVIAVRSEKAIEEELKDEALTKQENERNDKREERFGIPAELAHQLTNQGYTGLTY